MSRLVDIKSEKFWEVLFDEACVEGSQADRIENELSEIAVSEQEIRNNAIDEFAERLRMNTSEYEVMDGFGAIEEIVDAVDIDTIFEIAEEMKGGE